MAATTAAVVGAGVAIKGSIDSKNAADSANRSSERANKRSQEFIEKQAKLARSDAFNLYPLSMDALNMGGQGAYDILKMFAPRMVSTVNNSNLAAQETLLAALPQMNAALLGGDVDLSALQPHKASPGAAGMFKNLPATIPQFPSVPENSEATPPPVNYTPYLGGF